MKLKNDIKARAPSYKLITNHTRLLNTCKLNTAKLKIQRWFGEYASFHEDKMYAEEK